LTIIYNDSLDDIDILLPSLIRKGGMIRNIFAETRPGAIVVLAKFINLKTRKGGSCRSGIRPLLFPPFNESTRRRQPDYKGATD